MVPFTTYSMGEILSKLTAIIVLGTLLIALNVVPITMALSVEAQADQVVYVGDVLNIEAYISSFDSLAVGIIADFNWGDGTEVTRMTAPVVDTVALLSSTHTYTTVGIYAIEVVGSEYDVDGATLSTATKTMSVEVLFLPVLSVAVTAPAQVPAGYVGQDISVYAEASDIAVGGLGSIRFDWGDGSEEDLYDDVVDVSSMTGTHVYEAAKVIANVFGYSSPSVEESSYTDVNPKENLAKYIESLTQAGILEGYGDGRFQPHQAMILVEIQALMFRITGETPDLTAYTEDGITIKRGKFMEFIMTYVD